jgi:hypothetical protein
METVLHLILKCPFSKDVWAESAVQEPTLLQAATGACSIAEWWNQLQKRRTSQYKLATSYYNLEQHMADKL